MTTGRILLARSPAFLVLLLLALFAARLKAEDARLRAEGAGITPSGERPGPPVVVGIVVKGLREISEDKVRERIGTRVGEPYNPAQTDRDFLSLWHFEKDKCPFLDISIRPIITEKGVIVEYDLRERPKIAAVRWRYIEDGKETDYHWLLPRHYPMAKELPGQVYNEQNIAKALDEIRKAYLKRGMCDAKVKSEIAPAEGEPESYPALVVVTFVIIEGEIRVVKKVRFEGNTAFSDRELLSAIKRPEIIEVYVDGVEMAGWEHYGQELANFLELYYRQRGFLDAVIHAGVPMLIYHDGKPYWELVFEVEEGRRYRIGRVKIEENDVLTTSEILDVMQLEKFPYYSQNIEDALRGMVTRRYGNDGRIFTSVAVDRRFKEDYSVDLTFRINEDNIRKIRLMEPRGNSITRDTVVRREFALKPGDTYDQRLLARTMANLRGTMFFENVIPRPFAVGDDEVDLMFDITEGKTGQFQMALSYSSNIGVVGMLALKYDNFDLFNPKNGFRGGGQQFELSYSGGDMDRLTVSFVEPYFLGKPLSLGVSLYDETLTSGRMWTEGRTGGRIGLTKRISMSDYERRYFKMGLTLERKDVTISDIDSAAGHPIYAEEGCYTHASVRFDLAFDFIDNPRLPTKGWNSNIWGEINGKATGGEREFYKYGANFGAFLPMWKDARGGDHVLSVKLRGEWAHAYGDTVDVPVNERYHAGGMGTVRGFDYRSLGPRYSGEPIGGNFRAIGNVEYLVPLVPRHWIGVLFFDAGNVWTEEGEFDMDDVRMSMGFGFRIEPLGPIPITLFWSNVLNAETGDNLEAFTFTLGTFF